ncbi:hypothetical protein Cni_G22508 [Canna indica]|uniref:RSE1/DDB1/CPSF1 second beta-propeller domain-containing protein n=1 Tax=Canna indica TaxID=4628 RepID=A0AAQ3KSR8_9LILI|nr:hypothetical protein Cni_G22508 [Canna indica]
MPFALAIQVMQFRRFNMRSLELIAQGANGPIDAEGFQNALYAIDIGQNDLSAAFYENASYAKVIERISFVIHDIRKAIEATQDEAFRVLAIGNIEVSNPFGSPLSGCIPEGVRIISVNHPYVLAGLRNGILLCLEWPTISAFLQTDPNIQGITPAILVPLKDSLDADIIVLSDRSWFLNTTRHSLAYTSISFQPATHVTPVCSVDYPKGILFVADNSLHLDVRKLELLYSDPVQRLVVDCALIDCDTVVVSDQ